MLRVDPQQRPRLIAIIRNLGDRVTEARMNGWLGEVEGLQVSLDAARAKLTALDRNGPRPPTSLTDLGIPVIWPDTDLGRRRWNLRRSRS